MAQPIVNTEYFLTTNDSAGCFEALSSFNIEVLPQAAIEVPTAFTPGIDGPNSVVFARGWGIRELKYFRIYNRWGELMFETSDMSVGWDGTYKGKLQLQDNYGWVLEAESFISTEPIKKKGTITLLR